MQTKIPIHDKQQKTLKHNYGTNGGMSSRSHWLSVLRLYVALVLLQLWRLVEAHGAARAFGRHWLQTCCLRTLFHETRHLGLLTETETQEHLSWKRDSISAGIITGPFLYLWIIVIFYQLFGLSFWRHPFTAEHPLLRQWWNDKFLQICSHEEKLIYILVAWGWVHF